MYKVVTEQKGKKSIILDIVNEATGEIYAPKFLDYTCPEDYIKDDVIGVEPMTAKEPLNDEELEKMLTSSDYIAEEKLDGTRCTMHLLEGANRLFSRRISKKTDWYAENTDSVPHLRDFEVPEDFYGTILDGEMRIDDRDFKDVSSTLNCKYDEAILRQTELGYITFHAFDIIYFKGVYVAKLPLIKRKALLKQVIQALDFQYVKEEEYTDDLMWKRVTPKIKEYLKTNAQEFENKYPELYGCLCFAFTPEDILKGVKQMIALPKKAWYEYILLHDGEGLMLKDKQGTYKHTRGREYTKMKKFDTWDVVILDFLQPTRDYTGKELNNPEATWDYWYDAEDDSRIVEGTMTMSEADAQGLLPCTKHYAMDWIGTVKFGVEITSDELTKWQKTNKDKKPELIGRHLVVGECSGMNEETREYMTNHQDELINTVIEVGANEILKTGKLRHPRFIKFRNDKEAERCTWKDHLR
jgi:hypothetical protein